MNIREAHEAGLLTVGRRVKTDGNLSTADDKPFTGRIGYVTSTDVLINRDDEDDDSNWGVRLTNTVAQIVMLDVMPLKKGDFVKFNSEERVESEGGQFWKSDKLILGRTYEVALADKHSWIKIRGTPHCCWHHPDHFILVSSQSKTKSDNKGENIMNTTNVAVNDTIGEVLGEKKYKTVMLVNKYFGEEIPNNFTGKMLLEDKKDQFIKEAEDREKEALKKAAAKG